MKHFDTSYFLCFKKLFYLFIYQKTVQKILHSIISLRKEDDYDMGRIKKEVSEILNLRNREKK